MVSWIKMKARRWPKNFSPRTMFSALLRLTTTPLFFQKGAENPLVIWNIVPTYFAFVYSVNATHVPATRSYDSVSVSALSYHKTSFFSYLSPCSPFLKNFYSPLSFFGKATFNLIKVTKGKTSWFFLRQCQFQERLDDYGFWRIKSDSRVNYWRNEPFWSPEFRFDVSFIF